MKSIMFVCLGNICRSPIAEGVAQKLNLEYRLGLTIASAGTGDWHIGQSPCPNSVKVALQHGVDISDFKGKQVTKEDFSNYDLIVALDESNIANLKKMGCTEVLKLGDFGFGGQDVPDPYFFEGFEGFDTVYKMIEEAVDHLFKSRLTLEP